MNAEPLGQDYVLHEEIGRGALGVVRRATQNNGGPPLAAKSLRPELAADRRVLSLLLREEDVLRRLHHECIVALQDLVLLRGQLVLLMELVNGPNLRSYVRDRGGTLAPAEASWVAAQVAAGLAAAHEQGVTHLDVKPENILLELGTEPPRVKLADFGVAAVLQEVGTDWAPSGFTNGYVAPEILNGGAPTTAADVFSLGVVLVEMTAGMRPGPQPGNRRIPPGLPDQLSRIAGDCLALDPAARPSAPDLSERLRSAARTLSGMSAVAPPELQASPDAPTVHAAPPAQGSKESRTSRWVVAGSALVVILGLGAALTYLRWGSPSSGDAAAAPGTTTAATATGAPTASGTSRTAEAPSSTGRSGATSSTTPPRPRRRTSPTTCARPFTLPRGAVMRPLGALPKTPDPALVVHCFTQRGTTVLTFDRLTRDGDRLKNQNIIYRQVALAHDARVFGRSKLPAKMSIAEFLRAVDARLPRDVAVTLHYDGSKHVNRIREIPRN